MAAPAGVARTPPSFSTSRPPAPAASSPSVSSALLVGNAAISSSRISPSAATALSGTWKFHDA
ncbi:MAG: hypothetical protein DLM65_01755 [Candidatus Aeolococcus gillhamiae]|uniref:Uncharacterized protein n=1 Tax=Candidatus Aeolococcus gillhamiae TaxID=3127015 RepID=A0A2W6AZK3_9BACT|nr:MAG: hypothetical protein DLM65_01755 [Candidatus Dormibacter sp. RRmetagenome_bin12]